MWLVIFLFETVTGIALDLLYHMFVREEYMVGSESDKVWVNPQGDSWTVHHLKLLKGILTGN